MSKTKKRLIITFSIIGALVILMIIFGVFFSLRNIYVDDLTISASNRISAYDHQEIIETSNIKKGKNILFLKFDKAIENLEEKYPYGKFEIVRTFPNKVTIYMSEREPAFKIEVKQDVWQIYDEDLKCLEILNKPALSENGNDKVPTLKINSGYELKTVSSTGLFIDDVLFQAKVRSIIDGIYGAGGAMPSVMSDIILEYDQTLGFDISTFVVRDTGTKIIIQGEQNLKEKIAYGLSLYLRDISQYDPSTNGKNHTGHLDQVSITILRTFDPKGNKTFIVHCSVDDDV